MAGIGEQRRDILGEPNLYVPYGCQAAGWPGLDPSSTRSPLTEEARQALGGKAFVNCSHFPFKVGREGRKPGAVSRLASAVDRRLRFVPQLNDVYLLEVHSSEGFHISREHFLIERTDSGFVLVDRNSACGTWVGDERSAAVKAEWTPNSVTGTSSSSATWTHRIGFPSVCPTNPRDEGVHSTTEVNGMFDHIASQGSVPKAKLVAATEQAHAALAEKWRLVSTHIRSRSGGRTAPTPWSG